MRFVVAVLIGVAVAVNAGLAQQPGAGTGAPPAAVIKPVADGVHIFEYRGYQSMFVVDPAGVVVTDPMNPEAARVYLAEIRKMTSAPIRCMWGAPDGLGTPALPAGCIRRRSRDCSGCDGKAPHSA